MPAPKEPTANDWPEVKMGSPQAWDDVPQIKMIAQELGNDFRISKIYFSVLKKHAREQKLLPRKKSLIGQEQGLIIRVSKLQSFGKDLQGEEKS